MGIRMPDAIAAYTAGGETYLVTANEGDAREWGDEDAGTFYLNEEEVDFGDEGAVSPAGTITGESGLPAKLCSLRARTSTAGRDQGLSLRRPDLYHLPGDRGGPCGGVHQRRRF